MAVLVFFLEEPSAKAMLEGVMPRLGLPNGLEIRYVVFEGKQDMHKRLLLRLQHWQLPDSYFIVMRDQDSGDCQQIKGELLSLCQHSGQKDVLVRIACHELESFYLGDLAAVEIGLGLTGLAHQQQKKKFRAPDQLGNPVEELGRLTKMRYQKIDGSRRIGQCLHLDGRNKSHSFNVLIEGARRLTSVGIN
ncbi:DUF4276 family protein [Alcaligenes faecalis]|uniref:DUF4276 family protein n=1 Tax=Alcaligenes faecalis TaxID=511 RepID=UPI002AA8D8D6|nr:DUF4276 family protein [Alcaligenes faecalis]